jgi:hypothetical protein
VAQLINFMQLNSLPAFNAVFGKKTSFATVTPIDNTGKSVGGASQAASTVANNTTSLSAANFGSCTAPQVKFAAGLDGRKETAFVPVDTSSRPISVLFISARSRSLTTESYNHGSAQNIGIILQFMCDTLTNTCKANDAAKALCAQASTAAEAAQPPKSGNQADSSYLNLLISCN